jgi:hypothetical protein
VRLRGFNPAYDLKALQSGSTGQLEHGKTIVSILQDKFQGITTRDSDASAGVSILPISLHFQGITTEVLSF